MKKLIFALTLILTACGGGGSSVASVPSDPGPITPVITGLQNFGNIAIGTFSELNLNNTQGDNLIYDILAIGDVNMDGYDDILIGLMRISTSGSSVERTVKPVLLIFNPVIKQYEASADFELAVGQHVWPRQGVIADFDGDGRPDIFIGDTGVDGPNNNNCGYQNGLILNNPTGFVNAYNQLPKVRDYSHGLITADFDNSKHNSLLIINSPYIQPTQCNTPGVTYRNRSYIWNPFIQKELSIKLASNDFDFRNQPAINLSDNNVTDNTVGATTDLNGDGNLDLVFGGSLYLTILETNAQLSYNKAQRINPPAKFLALVNSSNNMIGPDSRPFTPYNYITFYDIDGDGQKEIIASLNRQDKTGLWVGQYFQVLQKINGIWVDISDNVFPNQSIDQSSSGAWCYRIQFTTTNNLPTLACQGEQITTYWTFNSSTKQFTLQNTKNTRSVVVKFPDGDYSVDVTFGGPFKNFPISLTGQKL